MLTDGRKLRNDYGHIYIFKALFFLPLLSLSLSLVVEQNDIVLFRHVMTLAILRGERVPTEEEAFLEDGGTLPSDAPAWWDPPQEGNDDGDDDGDFVDDDEDDEAEDGQGEEEEEGGGQLDLMSEGAREQEVANGGGALTAEGAQEDEERAHAVDISSKSNQAWSSKSFPGEQSDHFWASTSASSGAASHGGEWQAANGWGSFGGE